MTTDSRQQGVCPKCKGSKVRHVAGAGDAVHTLYCDACNGTGQQLAQPQRTFHSKSEAKRVTAMMQQPAQPGSGETVQRYSIRHLIDSDNVLEWPRALRKGPDVVLASDYDRLQSALTAAQEQLRNTREWILRADKLLAEAGYAPDCSIRHALACGLPSEQP